MGCVPTGSLNKKKCVLLLYSSNGPSENQENNYIHLSNNNSKNVHNTFIKSARLVTGTLLRESRDEGGERPKQCRRGKYQGGVGTWEGGESGRTKVEWGGVSTKLKYIQTNYKPKSQRTLNKGKGLLCPHSMKLGSARTGTLLKSLYTFHTAQSQSHRIASEERHERTVTVQ